MLQFPTHRHDPDLAFPWLDDARAVGTDQPGLGLLAHDFLHPHHVVLGDSLRDAHHKLQLSLHGLKNGLGGKRRRHIDDRGVAAGGGLGVPDAVEDREADVAGSALAGGDTSHHSRAISNGLPSCHAVEAVTVVSVNDRCILHMVPAPLKKYGRGAIAGIMNHDHACQQCGVHAVVIELHSGSPTYLLCVECAILASQALTDDLGCCINEYCRTVSLRKRDAGIAGNRL